MYILRLLTLTMVILMFTACAEKEQSEAGKAESEQEGHAHSVETNSDVPELWAFHDVIYQIWHEAWPAKDTKMLTDLIPDIEQDFAKLRSVNLPGILRDKQEAWSAGIEKMAVIIDTYKKTAAAKDETALLKTAENLHTQYESLVRLIRPVMKEIEHFHQELYMVYHYYLQEFDRQKIGNSAKEMITRLEAVKKAQLPARLKDKQQAFDQANEDLSAALVVLQQTINDESSQDKVTAAIESVHDKYQALVAIFE